MPITALPYIFITVLGIVVGSFANVLIFRLPEEQDFVKEPSHCMHCGHRLRWYELLPLVSFLAQGGRCRACGAKLSWQYPLVEGVNGLMWLATALLFAGDWLRVGLYCALFTLLLVLAVIDWRTYTLPNGLNLAVLVLGVVQLAADLGNWPTYLLGMCSVSLFFLLLWWLTGGAGIGMGDVKLMAAAGLLLGGPRILLAMIVGSVLGVIIHSLRMRRGAGNKLAFGPYLAAGIWFAALFGQQTITAYLGIFGL